MTLVLASLFAATPPALADQVPMLAPAVSPVSVGDPPARVGRLSDVQGTVWWYSPDNGDWVKAERNLPLTSGNRIATDTGARAEIRLGSTTIRLDAGTELHIDQLDDSHIALQLAGGTAMFNVRDSESARQFALTTADGRFVTPTVGSYRVDIGPRASDITVWSGTATYQGPGSALGVAAGQRAEFWLDERNSAQYTLSAPVRDAFAAWSESRDRAEDASAAARYVSPEMTGIEDLDRNGTWQQTPDDGAIWVPTVVAADWAPYSTGHWAWVAPWGWTWVDDAPWGFAPFHYGRWVHYNDRWGWAPGRYVARPCYAPALVGWFGAGAGAGVGVGVGIGLAAGAAPTVGWFPLAPHEVYVPRYHVSPGYVRDINITHVTNITNITNIVRDPDAAVRQYDYLNRRYAPAVTVVPASVLAEHRQVAPAAEAFRHDRDGRDRRDGRGPAVVAQATLLAAPPVAAPAARFGGVVGGGGFGGVARGGYAGSGQGVRDGIDGRRMAPPSPLAVERGERAAADRPAGGAAVLPTFAERRTPVDAAGNRVGVGVGSPPYQGVERRLTPRPDATVNLGVRPDAARRESGVAPVDARRGSLPVTVAPSVSPPAFVVRQQPQSERAAPPPPVARFEPPARQFFPPAAIRNEPRNELRNEPRIEQRNEPRIEQRRETNNAPPAVVRPAEPRQPAMAAPATLPQTPAPQPARVYAAPVVTPGAALHNDDRGRQIAPGDRAR